MSSFSTFFGPSSRSHNDENFDGLEDTSPTPPPSPDPQRDYVKRGSKVIVFVGVIIIAWTILYYWQTAFDALFFSHLSIDKNNPKQMFILAGILTAVLCAGIIFIPQVKYAVQKGFV